jgi:2-C-methyl-D-erythritol 4-phosphate cytidylyltransferase
MQYYAIIVAGGIGTRMGNALPKQFLPLAGKPMLYHSINNFVQALPNVHVVIVMHPSYISHAHETLLAFENKIECTIVAGGNTRYESVQNGFKAINAQATDIVLVHDAARPFVPADLIVSVCTMAIEKGMAIPVIAIAESVRMVRDGKNTPFDRSFLRIVQTPQVMQYHIMQKCFMGPYDESFTDEATVCQQHGVPISLVPGDENNIKITTPAQYNWAQYYISHIEA